VNCFTSNGYRATLSDPFVVQEVYKFYGTYIIDINVLKTPGTTVSHCVSCSHDTYSDNTGQLWCTDCAEGKSSLAAAMECAVATTPALEQTTTPAPTKLVYCQDDEQWLATCNYLRGSGLCYEIHTRNVIIDVTLRHEFNGSRADPQRNGEASHADVNGALDAAVKEKLDNYKHDYNARNYFFLPQS